MNLCSSTKKVHQKEVQFSTDIFIFFSWKSWHRRWFAVTNRCLYYFQDNVESKPKGIVPLENVKVSQSLCMDFFSTHGLSRYKTFVVGQFLTSITCSIISQWYYHIKLINSCVTGPRDRWEGWEKSLLWDLHGGRGVCQGL